MGAREDLKKIIVEQRTDKVIEKLKGVTEPKAPLMGKGDGFFVPNYSGVKSEALRTSAVDITAGVDWTVSQAPAVIHADNYTDTNTTAHASFSQLDYASAGHTGFAPALGADDNYVTDAEKIVIGNTSGTNTGDNAGVTSVTGTAPVASSGGTTPAISMAAATNAAAGHATAAHITAIEANTTHAADSTQAHSDYLLNSGTDIAVGPLTITADNSTADQAYVPMVLYNTDATPPAANTVPIGTIYVQYTA